MAYHLALMRTLSLYLKRICKQFIDGLGAMIDVRWTERGQAFQYQEVRQHFLGDVTVSGQRYNTMYGFTVIQDLLDLLGQSK